jgi:hypothetical protein
VGISIDSSTAFLNKFPGSARTTSAGDDLAKGIGFHHLSQPMMVLMCQEVESEVVVEGGTAAQAHKPCSTVHCRAPPVASDLVTTSLRLKARSL